MLIDTKCSSSLVPASREIHAGQKRENDPLWTALDLSLDFAVINVATADRNLYVTCLDTRNRFKGQLVEC